MTAQWRDPDSPWCHRLWRDTTVDRAAPSSRWPAPRCWVLRRASRHVITQCPFGLRRINWHAHSCRWCAFTRV